MDEEGTCSLEEIRLAELDTDLALVAFSSFQPDTGLKLDPDALTEKSRALLARAVAEQIRYRRLLGPSANEFMAVREYREASGDGFSRKGRRPKYADAAREYLRQAGLTPTRRVGSVHALSAQDHRDLNFEEF